MPTIIPTTRSARISRRIRSILAFAAIAIMACLTVAFWWWVGDAHITGGH